jgi:ABC-type thiamin/hydroxymethylpyrimidine transport system permease subunit
MLATLQLRDVLTLAILSIMFATTYRTKVLDALAQKLRPGALALKIDLCPFSHIKPVEERLLALAVEPGIIVVVKVVTIPVARVNLNICNISSLNDNTAVKKKKTE